MNTFLASAPNSIAAKSIPNSYRSAAIVYLEGYLFDRPEAKEAFRQAARSRRTPAAKSHSPSSDAFCVDRHRDESSTSFAQGRYSDRQRSEITSLYQVPHSRKQPTRADRYAACRSDASAEGSVIYATDQDPFSFPRTCGRRRRHDGRRRSLCCGFLYGLASGRTLDAAGRLGSLAAAEVFGHLGARPSRAWQNLARLHTLT